MGEKFRLVSPFKPKGGQPAAIKALCGGIKAGKANQTLLGVTGSGKTFTAASVITELNRPALVISPNKVLAAQLYSEFKTFFPDNAVEYFVSYYDYYQPEAYIPSSDTYIEKDASINDHIDKLRLKATSAILSRRDTIVVASVSCIYNIGSPDNFSKLCLHLRRGDAYDRRELTGRLVAIQYERNETEFARGVFRMRGGAIDIFPADMETAYRVELGDRIESIREIHPLTGDTLKEHKEVIVYPATHFVAEPAELERALCAIEAELAGRLKELNAGGKLLEAQRIEQRTRYDLEMMRQTGYCHGIENYSRHLSGRPSGERPLCLLDYFPKDFLLFMDESHVSAPQIRGMYHGDRSRKQTLVDFGFRLPSALDNRPLKFSEFEAMRPATVFMSATPGPYELEVCGKEDIVEQIIRPTGLVDPEVTILPARGQIRTLIGEIEKRAAKKERSLVLTLTKKTAEDLSEFLAEKKIRARYIHSSMDTLQRLDILRDFRKGDFDVLVGINLLREGLDIPEVTLVAILNADNEGFLRSDTTLVQISGRAARNLKGKVILFADRETGSMKRALGEMSRRRLIQLAYNKEHNIKPETIRKKQMEYDELHTQEKRAAFHLVGAVAAADVNKGNIKGIMKELEKQMKDAADNLNFELAKELRDRLFELRDMGAGRRGAGRMRDEG
ncbi:MAG: excinuclease ABC subunit B [Elusimicrobia bacterium GWA2_56_46]|nr:MAG: excinuclease ABC subunit B [Elusimicrobia bacterium GWA2_56_46]OGR54295.1 MAG: excinuclease ABC subunit B [Elusimicrobia bacterium GWC2_56_31]HBW22418.1 excinuclease ABC subunit B [Elusimicrobiota bacterium]